jgi:hypothetical protein
MDRLLPFGYHIVSVDLYLVLDFVVFLFHLHVVVRTLALQHPTDVRNAAALVLLPLGNFIFAFLLLLLVFLEKALNLNVKQVGIPNCARVCIFV